MSTTTLSSPSSPAGTGSARAWAVQSATDALAPFSINRRDPLPKDVVIDILYCGVCHTDLHMVRNEWGMSIYPMVPGHEIVGRVSAIGSDVTRFKAGDLAAVGCMVDSCRTCSSCRRGLEQYCQNGMVLTYGAIDKHSDGPTFGGYSERIVVDEDYTLQVPSNLELAAAAPLLCAGITTYSPLRHWKVGPGQKVGIVGLGGLGHMGVKFAHALGAHVVVFTTSPSKTEDAMRLGAHEVVLSKNSDDMNKHAGSFDFILDAVSADHDINAYLSLIKLDGALVLVGVPAQPLQLAAFNVILPRRTVSGSGIGGINETQEMLNFCSEHGITSDIEMIDIQQINEAYERLARSDVKYRFVIDMASIKR